MKNNQLNGLAALAKALGISKSTAHAWVHNATWPFSRSGPWNAADLPAMQRWADETLRRDNGPLHPVVTDDFWAVRDRRPPFGQLLEADGIVPLPPAKLPPLLVSAFEREVLSGRRKLTADEGEAALAAFQTFRTRMAAMADFAPSLLAELPASEVADRLRALVSDELENISRIFEDFPDHVALRAEIKKDLAKDQRRR